MKAAVIEDQTVLREFFGGMLQRRFGVTDLISIGSMAELREKESQLKGARLLLLDVDLGDGSTLEWAIQRAQMPDGGALVVVSSISGGFPFKQLQVANISIAHKNDLETDIEEVVRKTLAGALVLSPKALGILQREGRDPNAPSKILGPKELRILALLGQRLSNEDIAAVTGSAVTTVADHRKRIMRKLDLHTIEQVIDYALQHGIVHTAGATEAKHKLRP